MEGYVVIRAKRRTGTNPLAYLGVEPLSPFEGVVADREPTEGDLKNFNIGTTWINTSGDPRTIFMLVGKTANVATWAEIGLIEVLVSSFVTDAGTALPTLEVLNLFGGTNMNTAGAGNTVTFNVDNAPTFTGLITGNAGLGITAGTVTIISDTNAANAIVLRASGGPLEKISLQSNEGTGDRSITLESDSGGICFDSGGNISLTPATNSVAGTSLTIDAKIGAATFTGLTTAVSAFETFTITNAEVSASSVLIVTISNGGSNDARMTMARVNPAAGSFTVLSPNFGVAVLNGDVFIGFILLPS